MKAHDPERYVADFLGGGLAEVTRADFSDHLLSCDRCWQELRAAQRGRQIAESARTVAPAELRDRIRAMVMAEDQLGAAAQPADRPRQAPWAAITAKVGRGWPVRRVLLVSVPATAAVLVAVVLTLAGPPSARSQEPRALAAAVADFRTQELPGRQLPTAGAPDLSRLNLQPIGAGGGSYAGLAVDGYAYRDSAGRRLVLYLSQEPFPTAPGARLLEGPDGPWTAQRGDVVILCARAPHALLVVGQDLQLVRNVASQLGVL